MSKTKVVTTVAELRKATLNMGRIGLVPTMGNIHKGHLQLVSQARQVSDTVVVSVFVNRLQFGPNEDFDKYPRTFKRDVELLAGIGTDIVFAPTEKELYPTPTTCFVEPGPLGEILEGAHRPGFFRGVATVVSKLFHIVQPRVAVFGKKDFQQLRVIEHLVREQNFPIEIIGAEIFREPDGLASSSRNSYLTPQERAIAPHMHRLLAEMRDKLLATSDPVHQYEDTCAKLLGQFGMQADYISVHESMTLEKAQYPNGTLVILAAVRIGRTRLIDNVELAV